MIDHNLISFHKVSQKPFLHIISAGPSLRNFDFKKLIGQDVMTINNTLFHLPDYVKSSYHIYCEPLEAEYDNYIKMTKSGVKKLFTIHDVPGWLQIPPFADSRNFAFQVAIDVAVLLKYKKIFLYGFDFSYKDGYKYWWSESPSELDEEKIHILNVQKSIFDEFFLKKEKNAKITIVE
jgi:hypothetical protein